VGGDQRPVGGRPKKRLNGDGLAFAAFALADRLGKTVAELGDLTLDEMNGWLAYLALLEERRET
jgi:hypothetical protein